MPTKPLVLLDTAPRSPDQIFRPETRARLEELFEVVEFDEERVDHLLPQAFAIVGQPDLPLARIERAGKLRAVLNVEGNFLSNVDYAACFERGIHVLACGPAYGDAVAEYALGLALDLARGISREDRAFRAGQEKYVSGSTHDSVLLRHADIGLIGFGNLGRALRKLLAPFSPTLRVYDPWLPDNTLRRHDVLPCGLEDTLRQSRILFVLATVTGESEHLLGADELDLISDGARLVLVSRAAVVDFDALMDRVAQGRFLAAIDVWPEEPTPLDHPARALEGLVLSAHRAGGIPEAFLEIGELVTDDLALISQGLPPVRMQAAARELVGRYRNRPVS
jgi:phosphoglycerate dehydrogenase-like enzyme